MSQELQTATFEIEHFIPLRHRGPTVPENLVLACWSCNSRKADRIEITDPDTGERVPLFNPRRQVWNDHFHWQGHRIVGITAIGRAMVAYFNWNSPKRLRIRRAEVALGLSHKRRDSS